MPAPPTQAVRVTDDADNSYAFGSSVAAVEGIRAWFRDILDASCQGLSDVGIEEEFPGLQARLSQAIDSIPAPAVEVGVDELARFANAIAQSVLACCVNPSEQEALGVPTHFSVRPASRLEVPDFAALAELARER